jgi:hypothetical protein
VKVEAAAPEFGRIEEQDMKPHILSLAALLLAKSATALGASASGGAINLDLGRQLFVDDLLIAKTDLKRTFHTAEVCGDGPLLKLETPLELNASRGKDALPVAAPFGDGVWYDPSDGHHLFDAYLEIPNFHGFQHGQLHLNSDWRRAQEVRWPA